MGGGDVRGVTVTVALIMQFAWPDHREEGWSIL